MPTQHSGREEGRSQREGAEAYPFDPTLRFESQRGLDRLRCVSDRALAADFFAIFQAAELNTEAAILAQRAGRPRSGGAQAIVQLGHSSPCR